MVRGWLTRGLHQEREDIPRDEDLRQKAQRDQGASLGIKHSDDPAQGHVDAGSEEGGRDQDESALHDIRAFGEVWRLVRGEDTTDVSDGFHCLVSALLRRTWRLRRTGTADGERDHEPSSCSKELIEMKGGTNAEQSSEDASSSTRRFVVVESELHNDEMLYSSGVAPVEVD